MGQKQRMNQKKLFTTSQKSAIPQKHGVQWAMEDNLRFGTKSTTIESERYTEASWSDVSEEQNFRFQPQSCKIRIRNTFLEFEDEGTDFIPLRRIASAPASTFFSN